MSLKVIGYNISTKVVVNDGEWTRTRNLPEFTIPHSAWNVDNIDRAESLARDILNPFSDDYFDNGRYFDITVTEITEVIEDKPLAVDLFPNWELNLLYGQANFYSEVADWAVIAKKSRSINELINDGNKRIAAIKEFRTELCDSDYTGSLRFAKDVIDTAFPR